MFLAAQILRFQHRLRLSRINNDLEKNKHRLKKICSVIFFLSIRPTNIYKVDLSNDLNYSTVETISMAFFLCKFLLLAYLIIITDGSHFRGGIISW